MYNEGTLECTVILKYLSDIGLLTTLIIQMTFLQFKYVTAFNIPTQKNSTVT
jgi:hypothetical protein